MLKLKNRRSVGLEGVILEIDTFHDMLNYVLGVIGYVIYCVLFIKFNIFLLFGNKFISILIPFSLK